MFNSSLKLETKRVELRLLKKEYFSALQKVTGNPAEWEFFTANLADPKEFGLWMNEALQQYKAGLRHPFVIFDKGNEQIIGCTSYGNISLRDQRLEIGWTWLGQHFQGKGFNHHMKFLMLRHAFESMKFERVEFKTASFQKGFGKNRCSRRRCFKKSYPDAKQQAKRYHYYSILRNEWEDVISKMLLQI